MLLLLAYPQVELWKYSVVLLLLAHYRVEPGQVFGGGVVAGAVVVAVVVCCVLLLRA